MPAFTGTLLEGPRGGAFVEVPGDIIDELGGGGRIKVAVDFAGVPYRGSVVSMGGRMILGVLKDIRATNGWKIGDSIVVTIQRDTEERTVEVPPELAAVLDASAAARDNYAAMSYTCRREYAQWVGGAKREDTRRRRATKAADMLERGEKL